MVCPACWPSAADQGAYMGWLGNLVGNYMEWRNVWSDQGGRYKLAIRYASGENRNLQLHVNGEPIGFAPNIDYIELTRLSDDQQ